MARINTNPNAPVDAKYIVQTADSVLSAEQDLSALTTGFMKVANGTGVITSSGNSTIQTADLGDSQATSRKIAPTSYYLTSTSTDTTTSTTFAALTGMSQAITPSVASYAYCTFAGYFAINAAGGYRLQVQFFLDGVAQGVLMDVHSPVANYNYPIMSTARIALASGSSQTIDVRWNIQPNGSQTGSSFNKMLMIQLMSQ